MSNERPLSAEIIRYREKWAKDPTSRVFAQLADAYRKEGMLDEAIRVCQKGLELYPTYVSARMILGRAYLEQGALDEAAAEFERVLEVSADNVLAHRMLGDARQRQGRLGEAAKEYEAVLALIALDRETRQLLADVQASLSAGGAPPPPSPGVAASTPKIAPIEPGVPRPAGEASLAGRPLAEPPGAGLPTASPPTPKTAASKGLPATETLADLYAAQGHREEAAAIYREVLAKAADRRTLERKLAALESAGARRAVPQAWAVEAPALSPTPRGDAEDAADLVAALTAWREAVRAGRRGRGGT